MPRISTERFNEVADLVEQALDGNYKAQGEIKSQIKEATAEESLSTSDFPTVLKSVTEAAFLGQYAQIEPIYTQYTTQYNVNNLRPQAFYSLLFDNSNLPDSNGGETLVKGAPGGIPRIPELTEYPTFSFSASETSFGVAKYGARVNFSFEMLLNDEWGVLESLPTQLAQLARNQEDITAIETLVSPTGPNATFFNATNGNAVEHPTLTVDSLAAAAATIRTRVYNGNPVIVPSLTLMVPPALELEARRLLGVSSFLVDDPINGQYNVGNPNAGINLIVNPWIPVIDKSANAATTWYLLPTGGSNGVRPAVVFSKIRGRETPELRIHSNTGNYLGGGEVPGREGSFLNDDIEFRVRHYVGAAGIGFETTYVSDGTVAPS